MIYVRQLAGHSPDSLVSMLVKEAHAEGRLDQEAPDIRGLGGSVYAGALGLFLIKYDYSTLP